jgi:phosphatidylinositol alpha-1,6-mannosyltransferase
MGVAAAGTYDVGHAARSRRRRATQRPAVLRVTILTRRYWPALGGVERAAQDLAEALACDHDVRVVAQRIDDGVYRATTHVVDEAPIFSRFVHNGVEVVPFRPSRRRRAGLLPMVPNRIPLVGRAYMTSIRIPLSAYYGRVVGPVLAPLLAGADVLHVLGGEMLAAGAVRVAAQTRTPVVITPFAHPGEWGDDPASAWAYRQAAAVLATTRSDARSYTDMGVPEERLHVMGLVTRPIPAAPGVGLPVEDGEKVVLFLGRRAPVKGWDLLLEAARRLHRAGVRGRIAFVGPGQPLPSPPPNVLDVGAVSDAERAAWLHRADVLCLLSSSETFGLAVTEAWSVGTPVLVSDIPVLRELVEGSGGGVVVARGPAEVAVALERLLADDAGRREHGRAGERFWRERYAPEVVLRRHVELYAAVAG